MTRIAVLQMTAGIHPAANARTIVEAAAEAARLSALVERIRAGAAGIPDVVVHGPSDPRGRLPTW